MTRRRELDVSLLAGEVWAETQKHLLSGSIAMDAKAYNQTLDILLMVLARHEGEMLVNDKYRPVSTQPDFDWLTHAS